MPFGMPELGFQAGLFENRSVRGSTGRWVDGNLVRFRDGVPSSVAGWRKPPVTGVAVLGRARDMLAWRPNSQVGRYAAIGTNSNAYTFDGSKVVDITPAGFTVGRVDTILGAGYGGALYGAGTYGTPRPGTGLAFGAGGWTFDMFGEILMGCGIGDGTIYEFLQGTNATFVATANAPKAQAICVSDERHVFAFGCNGNPNLVMWCDRELRTVWTPLATNRAGSYDMQATSPFQCGKRVRGSVAAWTMTEAFLFSPLDNSLVYSNDRVGTNCGVMGPHAVAVVNDPMGDVAYWMGPHAFYIFDGSVRELPCDLWDYVFKNINLTQRVKAQARSNATNGEIWFWYCSAASNEIDRCVIYSYSVGTWSKADLPRLAWLDALVFELPLAVDVNGFIYEHEVGDTTDTGAVVPSFITSSFLMSGNGQQFMDIDAFWPDMQEDSGVCTVSFICRDFNGQAPVTVGPLQFDLSTEKLDLAISTRQVQIRIDAVEGSWELGIPQMNVQAGSDR